MLVKFVYHRLCSLVCSLSSHQPHVSSVAHVPSFLLWARPGLFLLVMLLDCWTFFVCLFVLRFWNLQLCSLELPFYCFNLPACLSAFGSASFCKLCQRLEKRICRICATMLHFKCYVVTHFYLYRETAAPAIVISINCGAPAQAVNKAPLAMWDKFKKKQKNNNNTFMPPTVGVCVSHDALSLIICHIMCEIEWRGDCTPAVFIQVSCVSRVFTLTTQWWHQ